MKCLSYTSVVIFRICQVEIDTWFSVFHLEYFSSASFTAKQHVTTYIFIGCLPLIGNPWGQQLDLIYFLIPPHLVHSRCSMNDTWIITCTLQSNLACFSTYKVFSINSRPLHILTEYLNTSAIKILITEAATMMADVEIEKQIHRDAYRMLWLCLSISPHLRRDVSIALMPN